MKSRWMIALLCAMVLLLGGIVLFSPSPMTGHLYLKEICIHNTGFLTDEEGGAYDYVVLYNPTDQEIPLKNYALSDQRKNVRLCELTEGSVPPKGETLLWISNAQTGFELSDREVLYLSNPQEAVIDKCGLPQMEEGMVYVRNIETGEWSQEAPARSGVVFATSPEETASNRPEAPGFSVPGGIYSEPVTLSLSAEKGCTIHYTLDATQPDETSPVYTSPLLLQDRSPEENLYAGISGISLTQSYVPEHPVTKGTVVRAVSISEDGSVSSETMAEYFINLSEKEGFSTLPVLSIVTNPENLFSASRGIYTIGKLWTGERKLGKYNIYTVPVNYNQSGKDWRRDAVATLYSADGNRIGTENVCISIHGGYSSANNQKSLNLFSTDGALYSSSLFGVQNHSLFIRAGGMDDASLTKLRDVLVQKLMEDRAVCTLQSTPVQVFLNGEYWGLYHLSQRIDRQLIANTYGVDKDDLLILKNTSSVGGKDREDYALYTAMVQRAQTSDLSDPEAYAALCGEMDMQSYIDYIAMEVYIANADSIDNNHGRWRTRSGDGTGYADGRWRWIAYDLDDSSGLKETEGFYSADTNSFTGGLWSGSLLDDALFSALMKSPEFRSRFVLTFMDMVNETFTYEKVDALLSDYEAKLAQPMAASLKRFVSANAGEADFHREVEKLRSFYRERGAYIVQDLKEVFSLGEKYQLTVEAESGTVCLNTLTLRDFPWQGEYFGDYALTLYAENAVGWLVNGCYAEGETLLLQLTQNSTVSPVFSHETP